MKHGGPSSSCVDITLTQTGDLWVQVSVSCSSVPAGVCTIFRGLGEIRSRDGTFVGGGGSLWAKTLGCSRSLISTALYLGKR